MSFRSGLAVESSNFAGVVVGGAPAIDVGYYTTAWTVEDFELSDLEVTVRKKAHKFKRGEFVKLPNGAVAMVTTPDTDKTAPGAAGVFIVETATYAFAMRDTLTPISDKEAREILNG